MRASGAPGSRRSSSSSKERSSSKQGAEVGRLHAGDFLGETALLLERPRTATVTASTNVRCLATSAAEFRTFVDAHPEVAWILLEAMAERLTDDG